jgi:DNA-binding MarR family transcriptional regulator
MDTPPFDPTQDPPGARLITGLAKIGLALKSQAWKGANSRGISPTQGQILVLLARDAERDQRLSDLAEALGVTAATTSDAVRSLHEKGLVTKTRSSGNALDIRLTETGRAEAARTAEWPDFLLSAVETLSGAEQAVFLRGLVKMLYSLQERGLIPVTQMCPTCRFFRPNVHHNPERPHHCAFVDAAFGDSALRLECQDHDQAPPKQAQQAWEAFSSLPAP